MSFEFERLFGSFENLGFLVLSILPVDLLPMVKVYLRILSLYNQQHETYLKSRIHTSPPTATSPVGDTAMEEGLYFATSKLKTSRPSLTTLMLFSVTAKTSRAAVAKIARGCGLISETVDLFERISNKTN